MTVSSLITAVLVGLVLGVLARWVVPACRRVPFWLPPAAGVGAALLGTVVARLGGVETTRVSRAELILQISSTVLSLGAVAVTADRRPTAGRYDKPGPR